MQNNSKSRNLQDKFSKLKFTCKYHGSEVGGVCDNLECSNKNQMICIKCFTDNQSCIKIQKHNLIPYSDFVDNFNTELDTLRKDYNYSKSITNVEYYLNNMNSIISDFDYMMSDINKSINDIYTSIIEKINKSYEEFNNTFSKLFITKQKLLKDSFDSLNNLIYYDALCEFKIDNLKEKMSRMPIENFNSTILKMKKVLNNMKNKMHINIEETINGLVICNESIVEKYKNKFTEIENELLKTDQTLKESLSENIFKIAKKEFKSISEFNLISEFTIDWSSNSNFLDKKFTIFDHTNGNTIFAYPTSQNTIKLEYFDKISNENVNNLTSNKTLNKETNLNVRDSLLYFKLIGHGAKINEILYHRIFNTDLLISSSDDRTIKIWEITDLNKYLDNPNEFQKSNCVKVLLHDNRISCFNLFYDPTTSTNYLISIVYSGKIKIWNLTTGVFVRDFEETINFDSIVKAFHSNNLNYVITANNNFSIRIWDFDHGKVIKEIKYPRSKFVSILPNSTNGEEDSFLIIDDTGKSSLLKVPNYELISLNLENFKTERVGAFKWTENIIYIFCNNGFIYEFNLSERKSTGKLRVNKTNITHAMKFHHHKDLLLIHTLDQKLQIYS